MCFDWEGAISTLNDSPLKLIDKFTYLSSSILSSESDVNMCLAKIWTAIGRLSIIWKSDLSNEIRWDFFQAVVVSVLLYGCTTWTLTKCIEKKLDGNCTRMLRAILNKSWKQQPTKQQLYSHLPPISSKTNKTCRTLLEKQGQTHEWCSPTDLFTWTCQCWLTSKNLTYNSSVQTQDIVWKTC